MSEPFKRPFRIMQDEFGNFYLEAEDGDTLGFVPRVTRRQVQWLCDRLNAPTKSES
jgi:hypothetical protein